MPVASCARETHVVRGCSERPTGWGSISMSSIRRLVMNKTVAQLLAIGLAGCQSMSSPETPKPEVGQAAQNWSAAFNSCDSVKAAALYDTEAVLWGTVAPALVTSPTGIQQYFERACASNPKP